MLLRITLTIVTSGSTPTSGGDGVDSMRLRWSRKVLPGSGERGRRLLWVVSHEAVVSLGDGIEISKRPEAAGREPS
jgi:hypothetical protein